MEGIAFDLLGGAQAATAVAPSPGAGCGGACATLGDVRAAAVP